MLGFGFKFGWEMFYLTILIAHAGHDKIAPVNNSNWEYFTWALCKLHITCITFVDYARLCNFGEHEW